MKTYKIFYVAFFLSVVCFGQKKFENKALNETFLNFQGEKIPFKAILKKHKGKKIFIDIWASWCPDCLRGLPKVKKLQKKYGNTFVWLFLSMDKSFEKWKKGIQKYKVIGNHYFVQKAAKKWKKSDFANAIQLDWIPRYIVINEKGEILLFKAITTNDKKLIEILKK